MTPLLDWAAFILFLFWGIGSVISCLARAKRYLKYQRDSWLLTDAIEKACMSIAFILAALVVSPHPIRDFDWLRNYSRLSWLLAFIPLVIGIILDWRSMARIERSERDGTLLVGKQ